MLVREIIADYCDNHTEHVNALYGQSADFFMLTDVVHTVTSVL
jgi:hypothetical protein